MLDFAFLAPGKIFTNPLYVEIPPSLLMLLLINLDVVFSPI
jgi:hypothetical protein